MYDDPRQSEPFIRRNKANNDDKKKLFAFRHFCIVSVRSFHRHASSLPKMTFNIKIKQEIIRPENFFFIYIHIFY